MNDWFIVRESKMLPGVKGAFALRDIPRGTQIIEYKGKLISKELSDKRANEHRKQGELWIFTLNKAYDIDASRQGNDARFINHSCEPNCEAVNYDDEELWIEATRDIKKGEELTYNYGFDEPDEAYPCLCGAKGCRGWIVAENYKFSPGEKEKLKALQKELLAELAHLENATHFVTEKKKKGTA
ncbi:SET domain-containing protein-lysine N-methyltransferase [Candidatus Woesearchaeota archaeon]|nr:SET domain-containing protein-lysine N-methyltransferase [Candidatus Woesearchaeota archaeon]